MPVNAMIIRTLLSYDLYYGDNLKIECPTGSGRMMNLFEVSKEIANRLTSIFLRDGKGKRAVYGGTDKFQSDPHWRDYLQFYEYFHGDNGGRPRCQPSDRLDRPGREDDRALRQVRSEAASSGRKTRGTCGRKGGEMKAQPMQRISWAGAVAMLICTGCVFQDVRTQQSKMETFCQN